MYIRSSCVYIFNYFRVWDTVSYVLLWLAMLYLDYFNQHPLILKLIFNFMYKPYCKNYNLKFWETKESCTRVEEGAWP